MDSLPTAPSLFKMVGRGLRKCCPRCGKGSLFEKWGLLKVRCEDCALPLRVYDENTWFFMYMSTAGITGIFILSMLLMTPPKNELPAKIAVGLLSLAIFFLSHQSRKGMAVAWEYWVDSKVA